MKSIKCPQCELVNFADAFVCKRCNHQFQSYSQTVNQPYAAYNQAPPNTFNSSNTYQNQPVSASNSSASVRKMFFGALWAIGGTFATVLSYNSTGGGGKYFIFWGAILFGAIDFLVGLNGWISGKN
jgi:hypothetical protein